MVSTPYWLYRERTYDVLHDCYDLDRVRVCFFHRYYRSSCDFWYVLTSLSHRTHLEWHSSLGAFLTGLIVPREGNLAIALTEKLEDMVSIIFLPLVSFLPQLDSRRNELISLKVLYAFRTLDRPRSFEQRSVISVHYFMNKHCEHVYLQA